MKKILSILILGILLTGLVAPIAAQAQEDLPNGCKLTKTAAYFTGAECGPVATMVGSGVVCDPTQTGMKDCGMCCLLNVTYVVCDWIFYLMMIGVVILFVIAAAMFMMSSGDAEKTKGAKGIIIGLVIALVAKLVPSVVKLVVGM
ncbi:MAG: hypothetical protein NTZ42_03310 [Candidatus Gribaldobacteria bacterium]|nr:hypothetical protein [Candidatus Gribaldobacteria bacterium]